MLFRSKSQDPWDLERFVQAQQRHYADALAELRAGRKRTHWSWYVLPQLAGLGRSDLSRRYAISGLNEARAYLAHPLLGPRLHECVAALNRHPGQSATDILGPIDALKLHSCLSLFLQAAPDGEPFQSAIDRFFGGTLDAATLRLLAVPPATR